MYICVYVYTHLHVCVCVYMGVYRRGDIVRWYLLSYWDVDFYYIMIFLRYIFFQSVKTLGKHYSYINIKNKESSFFTKFTMTIRVTESLKLCFVTSEQRKQI